MQTSSYLFFILENSWFLFVCLLKKLIFKNFASYFIAFVEK